MPIDSKFCNAMVSLIWKLCFAERLNPCVSLSDAKLFLINPGATRKLVAEVN